MQTGVVPSREFLDFRLVKSLAGSIYKLEACTSVHDENTSATSIDTLSENSVTGSGRRLTLDFAAN